MSDIEARDRNLSPTLNGNGHHKEDRVRGRSASRSPARRSRSGSFRSPPSKRARSHSRSRSPRRRSRSPRRREERRRSNSRSPRRHRDRRSRSRSPHYRRRSPPRFGGRGGRFADGRDNPDPCSCLGVFGMSTETNERDLKKIFGKYGELESVQIVYDRNSGRSRGFGFVYFSSTREATKAKDDLRDTMIDGQRVRIDYSVTRTGGPGRRRRSRSISPSRGRGRRSRSRS